MVTSSAAPGGPGPAAPGSPRGAAPGAPADAAPSSGFPHDDAGAPTGFDTVVVAGGRSSRLGGTPKAGLPLGDSTLLAHTVAAGRPFGTVVVVGPEDQELPADVLRTREDPPFSGPAAAIAAGAAALRNLPARRAWTAVLACDMPAVDRALPALVEEAGLVAEAGRAASSSSCSSSPSSEVDGVIAVSAEGRRENLAVLLRTEALERALEAAPTTDASVRSVWRHLRWAETPVPEGSTADVDTWDDVRRLDLY